VVLAKRQLPTGGYYVSMRPGLEMIAAAKLNLTASQEMTWRQHQVSGQA